MPDAWFDTGTDLVLNRLQDREARVLVRRRLGASRGPSMGFAVLLAQGWDPLDALDAIRTAREVAHIGYAEDALDWWLRRNGENREVAR
jgi:dual specificity phosphatase 3